MRKHKTLTLIVFFTLILFNYTLNANSLNIALFLPFNSSSYSLKWLKVFMMELMIP